MSKLTLSIAAIMTLWAFPENRTFIRFDAKWWHHTNSDEQQGFIYGYRDCRQPPDAPKVSINDEQSFVSMTLDSHKSDAPDAVTAALHLAWKTMKSQAIEKGAEVFAGPHGFLDGEWWGSFRGRPWPSALADADRGYLEGYLECAASPVTVEAVRSYQASINQHYASGRHEHDKIADVLRQLLNHAR
jgi:hypothetical protein